MASNDDVCGVALISNGLDFWRTYHDKGDATHVALSLAPEAQAARRDAVCMAVPKRFSDEDAFEIVDAVLKALGLAT